jgi:hypothetical protein
VRTRIASIAALLLALILAGNALIAQTRRPAPMPLPTDPQFSKQRNSELTEAEERMERQREKQMNQQRHASLKEDTDKLLELATELKKHVDESNENLLSLEVVKKAEEIEKLAKKVKDKMKG